jgi:hypothetical protein
MYPAECLKDEKTSIFYEVLQTSNQEEIVQENLKQPKKCCPITYQHGEECTKWQLPGIITFSSVIKMAMRLFFISIKSFILIHERQITMDRAKNLFEHVHVP